MHCLSYRMKYLMGNFARTSIFLWWVSAFCVGRTDGTRQTLYGREMRVKGSVPVEPRQEWDVLLVPSAALTGRPVNLKYQHRKQTSPFRLCVDWTRRRQQQQQLWESTIECLFLSVLYCCCGVVCVVVRLPASKQTNEETSHSCVSASAIIIISNITHVCSFVQRFVVSSINTHAVS